MYLIRTHNWFLARWQFNQIESRTFLGCNMHSVKTRIGRKWICQVGKKHLWSFGHNNGRIRHFDLSDSPNLHIYRPENQANHKVKTIWVVIHPFHFVFPWFVFYKSWMNRMKKANIMNKQIKILFSNSCESNEYVFIIFTRVTLPIDDWFTTQFALIRFVVEVNLICPICPICLFCSANFSDSHMLIQSRIFGSKNPTHFYLGWSQSN